MQCRPCELLVARYSLAVSGYFHAEKEFEGLLRSIGKDSSALSGRDFQDSFNELEHEVNDTFGNIRATLTERYGEDTP